MAGCSMRLLLSLQDMRQHKVIYGEQAGTFMPNAGGAQTIWGE